MCQLLWQPSIHPGMLRWMGMSGDVVVGHDNNKISQTTQVAWLNCCLVVQLFGCLVVWLFSYFVVQLFCCLVILLFSCLVVQLFSCLVILLFSCFSLQWSRIVSTKQQDNKTTKPQWSRIVSTKQQDNKTTRQQDNKTAMEANSIN